VILVTIPALAQGRLLRDSEIGPEGNFWTMRIASVVALVVVGTILIAAVYPSPLFE
jgi:hypothetical protein